MSDHFHHELCSPAFSGAADQRSARKPSFISVALELTESECLAVADTLDHACAELTRTQHEKLHPHD